MEIKQSESVTAIRWRDDRLELLDQRLLPAEEKWLSLFTVVEVTDAIRNMVVRGAPAIGIAAAYGIVLSAMQHSHESSDWPARVLEDLPILAASRPTAVNLFWAIERMQVLLQQSSVSVDELLEQARQIQQEDIAANHRMGELGAAFLTDNSAVLTHCNAGALATGGYGTALGVIRSGFAQGKIQRVFADETRPWLQGSRLTAWELLHDHIPVTLLAEGAAASLMAAGQIQWVIVGSDRIAANGDVANKIGTYSLAVLARYHGVRFMVAAPSSTVDMDTPSGADIPIESRDPAEILQLAGQPIAARGADAWNPVFDVTPAELVDVIVTERGVVEQPSTEKIARMMRGHA
jgi:methylthioribose-1-phosphate isomerase